VRKLGVFVAVVALIAVGADFGARWFVERAVATELSSSFELTSKPSVAIGGFPFIVRFLDGTLPSVRVEATEPSTGDLLFERIELTLEDVSFDPERVLGGSVDRVRTRGGDGIASFSDESLTRALRDRGVEAAVAFRGGEVVVESGGTEVGGDVELEGARLLVSSDAGVSTAVDLPSLGGHAAYEGLELGDGAATLAVDIAPGSLRAQDEALSLSRKKG
jgi:hypothetical protein